MQTVVSKRKIVIASTEVAYLILNSIFRILKKDLFLIETSEKKRCNCLELDETMENS